MLSFNQHVLFLAGSDIRGDLIIEQFVIFQLYPIPNAIQFFFFLIELVLSWVNQIDVIMNHFKQDQIKIKGRDAGH